MKPSELTNANKLSLKTDNLEKLVMRREENLTSKQLFGEKKR